MGGGGLLIFYVANVANVANVSKCILLEFPTAFSAQKPYLCTEFQSALKLQSTQTTQTNENYATNTRNYEPPYLPAAQPKHKGRV